MRWRTDDSAVRRCPGCGAWVYGTSVCGTPPPDGLLRFHLPELIAEVEFLLGSDAPERIAKRLGFADPNTLARRLQRAGRYDLAAPFVHHKRKEAA